MSKDFFIYSDASNFAMGAVLCQVDENDFPRPVAFASKKFKDAEARYSTSEREIYAIVWSVNHFKHYLLGREFTIFTDHHSLTNLINLKDPTNRISRWAVALSNYRYKIKYIAGKCNKVADFLSRGVNEVSPQPLPVFVGLPTGPGGEQQILNNNFKEKLRRHQQSDDMCKQIKDKLERGEKIHPLFLKFFKKDGILWCRSRKRKHFLRPLMVVPRELINQVLFECHDCPTSGHLGTNRTLAKIRTNYYWPGMNAQIRTYVKSCEKCNKFRAHLNKRPPPLIPLPVCQGIGERVHVDFVGPLNVTAKGNRYVLVFTDAFSRYIEAFPTPNMTAETVNEALVQYISRHGLMNTLVSDRGANFLSRAVSGMCSTLGIKRISTSPYHPSSNGVVERNHGTLMKILANIINRDDMQNWDSPLSIAILAYNTAINESTGFSPGFLTYGRNLNTNELNSNCDFHSARDMPDYVKHKVSALKRAFREATRAAKLASARMVKRREAKATRDAFQIGDLVFLYDPARDREKPKYLREKNKGPFKVVQRLGPVNYRLKCLNSPHEFVTHVEKMSYFAPRDRTQCGRVENEQRPRDSPSKPVSASGKTTGGYRLRSRSY